MGLTNDFSQHNQRLMLKHGGNLEQEAKRLGVHLNSLIDASVSLVPFALPTPLQNCLTQQINGTALKIYPDRSYLTLREAISNFHKIHSSMVLPGNGASEIINFNRQPEITFENGELAQCKPIINNGKIVSILLQNAGRNYHAPPDIEIKSATGDYAQLTPRVDGGKISEIKVINEFLLQEILLLTNSRFFKIFSLLSFDPKPQFRL